MDNRQVFAQYAAQLKTEVLKLDKIVTLMSHEVDIIAEDYDAQSMAQSDKDLAKFCIRASDDLMDWVEHWNTHMSQKPRLFVAEKDLREPEVAAKIGKYQTETEKLHAVDLKLSKLDKKLAKLEALKKHRKAKRKVLRKKVQTATDEMRTAKIQRHVTNAATAQKTEADSEDFDQIFDHFTKRGLLVPVVHVHDFNARTQHYFDTERHKLKIDFEITEIKARPEELTMIIADMPDRCGGYIDYEPAFEEEEDAELQNEAVSSVKI